MRNNFTKPNPGHDSGFSLVETLIYLAILSMIMSVLVPTFYTLESLRDRIVKTSEALNDRIFIESQIRQLLKTQTEIIEPRRDTSADELILDVAAGNSNEDLFTFRLENQKLTLNATPLHGDGYLVKSFNARRLSTDEFGNEFGIFEIIQYEYDFGTSSVSIFINE